MSGVDLRGLHRCFQGILPSNLTTCSADGVPNTSPLSQAYLVDERHVALSCQFFNKTRKNLAENPYAELEVMDPLDLECHRLTVKFIRAETSGPLFDSMALRLDAIAALSGMQGVFKLRSADVFEVSAVERAPGLLQAAAEDAVGPPAEGPYEQLRALQILAQRINRARTMDDLFESVFAALEDAFGFQHAMLLVPDGSGQRLVTVAAHGYGESERGVGAEVALGEGVIGTVAQQRKLLRIGNVESERNYHRTMRARSEAALPLRPEIPLPGLPDAHSQAALPLLVGEDLVGVLFLESPELLGFDHWSEPLLDIVGYQVAMGIDRLSSDDEPEPVASAPAVTTPAPATRRRTFTLFRRDDCVFVDGEYLVRNVPGLVLWKLLAAFRDHGQTEFSNRELRLDPALKLPALRDNLESRLILLRKRLVAQCPDVRLVPVRRGRFALQVDAAIDLVEKA
jgi:adenylate cyclase